ASYDQKTETAMGYIVVPQNILPNVVGTPTLSVAAASSSAIGALKFGTIFKSSWGFTFQASWPGAIQHDATEFMQIRASFSITCDGGTQAVQATTDLYMCIDGTTFDWASSGDACTICEIIAEMAPSPI